MTDFSNTANQKGQWVWCARFFPCYFQLLCRSSYCKSTQAHQGLFEKQTLSFSNHTAQQHPCTSPLPQIHVNSYVIYCDVLIDCQFLPANLINLNVCQDFPLRWPLFITQPILFHHRRFKVTFIISANWQYRRVAYGALGKSVRGDILI